MTDDRYPVMDERKGEGAVLGAVLFRNIYAAERFIDWKLRQGLSVRLKPKEGDRLQNDAPLYVRFEP